MRSYDDSIKRRRGVGNRFGKARNARDSAKQLYRADRAAYVSEEILAGKTFRKIAKALGVGVSTVHRDYEAALLAKKAKNVDELRDRYNARYETVVAGHIDKAVAGDVRSAEVVIKATAAAARLNGAEVPMKHELTGKNGAPIAVSLADVREALRAAASNVGDDTGSGGEQPGGDGSGEGGR